MAEFVNISGLRELQAALKELPDRVAKNALRASVYAGAKIVRDDAKQRAPIFTGPVSQGHPPPGTLKKAVIMKQIPEQSGKFRQTFYVAVRHGKKYQKVGKKEINRDAFYWRFVEFGTANMAARPFMRPAFESQKLAAVEAIKAKLADRIEEEAQKLGRP